MANFEQAIRWLEEGKGVKRTNWRIDGEVHLILKDKKVFECEDCGLKIDRDLNASLNIKKLTETKLNNTEGHSEFQACGDIVRPCFEFEKIQKKASVCEVGNYREISRRSQ